MNRKHHRDLFSRDPATRTAARNLLAIDKGAKMRQPQGPNGPSPIPPPITGPIRDTTGRPIARGQLVHIPTNSIPSAVLQAEVMQVIEPSKIVGAPGPRQPMVVVAMHIMIPVQPDGTLPFCYIVGEVPKQPDKPQEETTPPPVLTEGIN